MKGKALLALALSSTMSVAIAADAALDTEQKRFSYTVGFQMAQGLREQGIEVDTDALITAVRDVLSGAPLKLSLDEMQTVSRAYIEREQKEQLALAEQNKKSGEAFLTENKKKKDVTTTPSGLQYTVIKEGAGKKPQATDTVSVHYRGTFIDGKEFDSSIARGQPVSFPVNGVIKGWQEALPMMKEGAKWKVVIPSDLAYGPRGNNAIGPNQTLVFEIELLSVKQP